MKKSFAKITAGISLLFVRKCRKGKKKRPT